MLNELRDSAGQHELIAENVQERILSKISQTVKMLKEERRKCIEEKEKYFAEHQSHDENLEKCKSKYEKAFKEVEKAEDCLAKVENDDAASKNDIKKQKSICDAKKRIYDTLEAEYGKQLCEANRVKNLYYYEQLPAVFDQLQAIETKRIDNFKNLVNECTKIEIEVLPRIHQCLKEIELAAQAIRPEQDTEMCVNLFKTGYQIPDDHVFVYLNSEKQNFNKSAVDNAMNQHQLNGSINSNNSSNCSGGTNQYGVGSLGSHNTILASSSSLTANNAKSRQNKYRTLNRIKGLFLATSNSNKNENDLYDLPPQQLKNELIKKVNQIQLEIDKQHKER
jgi:formin-binding protein 1